MVSLAALRTGATPANANVVHVVHLFFSPTLDLSFLLFSACTIRKLAFFFFETLKLANEQFVSWMPDVSDRLTGHIPRTAEVIWLDGHGSPQFRDAHVVHGNWECIV